MGDGLPKTHPSHVASFVLRLLDALRALEGYKKTCLAKQAVVDTTLH
jgi:hypothetical protein